MTAARRGPVVPGAITQHALPPYSMHCSACGQDWIPPLPRGSSTATEHSLDKAAQEHWRSCAGAPLLHEHVLPPRPPGVIAP